MSIVVVGDLLLDRDLGGEATRLSPDAPVPVIDVEHSEYRAGGAGLVAHMLAADGNDVVLVSVVADDEPAQKLRAALDGIRLVCGPSGAPTPVKTRVRAAGQAVVRFDEGCSLPPVPAATDAMLDAIAGAEVVIVADYGRRLAENADVRLALEAKAAHSPVVWDPHPAGATPVRGLTAVTPNHAEALKFGFRDAAGDHSRSASGNGGQAVPDSAAADDSDDTSCAAAALSASWGCDIVVTLGRQGALLHTGTGAQRRIPAPVIRTSDPCGAGDRFVATLAVGLAAGAALSDAVHDAVHTAATFLADGGVGTLQRRLASADSGNPAEMPSKHGDEARRNPAGASAMDIVARVREAGGTVVATGGCFDLIHAGHARTLQAARALGDCLVVVLNSDESVRRLKGADRPIISARDRMELLSALGCVDGVLLFEEDTPHRILEEVRPDVWVKGGDYDAEQLPEAELIASWGGRTVTVPYHVARSTTSLAAALAKVG